MSRKNMPGWACSGSAALGHAVLVVADLLLGHDLEFLVGQRALDVLDLQVQAVRLAIGAGRTAHAPHRYQEADRVQASREAKRFPQVPRVEHALHGHALHAAAVRREVAGDLEVRDGQIEVVGDQHDVHWCDLEVRIEPGGVEDVDRGRTVVLVPVETGAEQQVDGGRISHVRHLEEYPVVTEQQCEGGARSGRLNPSGHARVERVGQVGQIGRDRQPDFARGPVDLLHAAGVLDLGDVLGQGQKRIVPDPGEVLLVHGVGTGDDLAVGGLAHEQRSRRVGQAQLDPHGAAVVGIDVALEGAGQDHGGRADVVSPRIARIPGQRPSGGVGRRWRGVLHGHRRRLGRFMVAGHQSCRHQE